MGLTFTKLFARLFSKKEMRILMVCGAVVVWKALAAAGRCGWRADNVLVSVFFFFPLRPCGARGVPPRRARGSPAARLTLASARRRAPAWLSSRGVAELGLRAAECGPRVLPAHTH